MPGGRGRGRRADSGADETGQAVLAPITPLQQTFIEHLLTGKTIKAAARLAGVSERTALYWMADRFGPVVIEYEKQRAIALAEFDRRVARLHELAFSALEDLLGANTPPFIRIQAVKLLYENHLREYCDVRRPASAAHLASAQADRYYEVQRQEGMLGVLLYDDRGNERIGE